MKHASLNHVYRLVWSELANALVAVAEHRTSRRKRNGAAAVLTMTVALGAMPGAYADGALPTAGRVTAGSGSIAQNGSTMTVTQGSDRLVIDWNSFDIGAANGVRFAQPGTGSIALNRVTGGTASSIMGSLTANGQVWLINPSGVVFGSNARVDVGGIVASTLSLSDSDFLAGRNRFTGGTGAGAVVNQGRISATGGIVALLGPQVRNVGTITTTGGSTVLAAGDRVSLDFNGDGLVSVNIDRSVVDALAENSGRISADGGLVVLSARSANKALDSVVNNTGVIEAKGLVERDGRILLDGDVLQGTTHVSGTLDTSSATGHGGAITVTGRDIRLDQGATLDASGATGGGSIRVGGGFQGNDATVANATTLGADGSVTARADATGNGDGGKVVFWSDDATRFAGNLSVRGGALGGDGGSIEVSGKQDLSYSGRADARAPLGRTGELLLDPATLAISGGGTGSGVLTGTTVYEKDLEAQNANVLLQATGNVTFNDLNLSGGDGTISMANNVSLRVEGGTGTTTAASGNITFTNPANTIAVSGTGSLMFVAGSLGTGNIVNAPNLIASGAGTNPTTTLPTHTVTTVGNGTPGNGSITLFGADGVTVGGSVTTNGGYVRVWADSDNASGGGYTLSAPVVTNGGNFYVSAGTGVIGLNSNMTLGTGRILFQADGSYTTGARTLGGVLSASGAVNVNTPFTMNAGAGILTDGVITFSNTVNLNTGAGALRLRASAIDFTAATLSNLSTASMILEPANPATSMVLGDASGFASATTLAKLPGVRNLTIGRTDGTGTTSVASDFSFNANGMLEVVNRTVDITGGKLTNTTGNVTLTGDNVNISQQVTSNAGAGSVTLRQLTAANPINLGTGLPNSVLGQINAATLVIGRSDGGDVTFDSNIATSATTVHLLSGGQVIGTAGGVSAANLAINAGGGATLSAPAFNFTKLGLAVGGTTAITQTNSGFDIAAVDGVAGLSINAASNANVTLQGQGPITASSALALNGNTSTVTFNAPSVNLAASTVSGATNTSFALRPLNAGDNLAIGGTSGFATTATLGKLTNSRNVTVGRSDGTGLSTVQAFQLAASGTLELVNGQVTLAGSVRNTSGGLKLTALAGDLALNATATAGNQLTLSATGTSVGGTGNVVAPGLLISAPLAAVVLNSGVNNVGTIAGNAGSLSFVDAASLAVGTVGGVNGVNATAGSLTLRTASDLTLNQAVSGAAAGNAVVLSAGGNFINNSGASAIGATGGGRWLVYSGSPLNDTRGGLAYGFKQYNTANLATALGSGNGFVYRVAPVATIGLTGTTGKVYDGGTTATLTSGNYTVGGTIDGDVLTFASTGASYATKGVASGKSVSANGLSLTGVANGAATVYGYQLANATATGNIGQITPATLTVGVASIADRVYDTTTVASVNGVALTGVIGSDAIGTHATGAFADKNIGSGKAVAVSGVTLTGADAGNYVLSSTTSNGTANITPATLTVGASTIVDKVYDASTVAVVSVIASTGVLGSDVVGVTAATGIFADKNVGSGKAVTVSGVALTGADRGNYVLTSTNSNGTASITPATLLVGASTIADKVYDTTTAASVGSVALTGVIGSDDIRTSGTGAFGDKNVGNGKFVTVSGVALTGADRGNYVLSSTNSNGTASITPATLRVGASTIADKVYDATTVASVGSVALTGVIGSDDIGISGTGAFGDKNVGVGKAVTVSGVTLSGADRGNYVLSSTNSTGTASITPATLTVGASTIADKVYDATTVASVGSVALTGVIGSDDIGTSGTGAFVDKYVGAGKAVTVSGVALSGTDRGNYVLSSTNSNGTASITPATLLVGASTIADKVYDTTTAASVGSVALTGVIGSDDIGTSGTGAFVDKNAGNGKAVTVSGVALTGTDRGNYVLSSTNSNGTASITPATLTVGASTIADKVYDATTVASVGSVALTGVIGSDEIGTRGTGTFGDKNVVNGKAVTVAGVVLTGSDAGNYVLDTTSSIGTANITPALLAVGGATVADKVYDATTVASVTSVALTGVIGRDDIGTRSTGAFADKNAGGGKVVTVSGVSLTGADAGNYVLSSMNSNGTATITPATLTVRSSTVADKVYDATTGASVTGVVLNGVFENDAIGSTATGTFADKNVGNGKVVALDTTLTGADAGNYVVSPFGANGAARITPALLNVGRATVADKVYDATTSASVGAVALTGVIGDDVIGTTATGAFANKNVGTGKAVSVDGVVLTGSDAANYMLDTTSSIGSASIAPARLAVGGATVADKVYDATTVATVSALVLTGVIGDDVVGSTATGAFANKNVGTGKVVTVGGVVLTGSDAANYVLDTTSSIGSASITPARLAVGGATVADKVYDATTVATVSAVALAGVIGDDVIGTTATGTFANKNVGNGKAVTVDGVALTGTDAGNYRLATTGSVGTASITPAVLTVGRSSIADKVYDATTVASVSGVALSGVIGGDDIGTSGTGAFADKNVGNGKAVTVGAVALTGADAANYVLDTTRSIGSADISPALLTVGAATIANKVYDATTVASVSGVSVNGLIGGDVVGTGATGAFADKNVGDGKAVVVSGIALSGTDAGNYALDTTSARGAASITPALLTLTGASVVDRVYDATTVAVLNNVTIGGRLGGDAVQASGDGAFADAHAGTAKAVSLTNLALTGSDARNYVFDSRGVRPTGTITPAMLTVGPATIADKVYDGGTTAVVGPIALAGVLGGDAVGTTASGAFVDRNVASGKLVNVGGIGLTGASAGDYRLDRTITGGTANISPATLTVRAATVANKVYDATTVASVGGIALDGVIGGDAVAASGTGGAFADKNVGSGKAVTIDAIGLRGADAGNYRLDSTATVGTATITPAMLTVAGAAVADKRYDGSTSATVGAVDLSGVLGADRVAAGASGRFADPDIGIGKPVAVSDVTLGGADAGNYRLASSATTARATIEPPASLPLVGTLSALTSPQAGSNGTAGRSSASVTGSTDIATTVSDGVAARGTSNLVPADSGAATRAESSVSINGRASSDPSGDRSDARVGGEQRSVAMVEVSDTVLTSGDQISIARDGANLVDPVVTSLPVFSMAPGAAIEGQGQFIVTDRGASVSLTSDGRERLVAPPVTARVTGSAEAMVPLADNRSVTMRVDLLADGTLVARIASPFSEQDITTLATYGLIVAKTGLSIAVDDVRAVVLQFDATDEKPGDRRKAT